ncbi:MAG: TolC family protein, partial [Thermoanaerobaculia bacterium]
SREDFQFQIEGVIQQVADTYWNLVEAREQLTVAQESLSLAQDLHKMNKIQVEVGTMAPLETVQSEAGVAIREEDIIRRHAAVEDSADALRRLVNLDRRELWDIGILPVTAPEIAHYPIDVAEAIDVALENRPDVRRQRLLIKNRELDAKVAQNQKKPSLELRAAYGLNAVDGNLSDPVTGELIEAGGYSDALQQILDIDFDGWSLGLTFAYPLQNRVAKARSIRADLALAQIDVELRDLEQQVVAEVRRTARGVETAAKQIESAKVSSRLARENLNAEQKRYENGLSTSFQVLEIQEDLSLARSREVSAVITYRRALTGYRRSVGRLLEAHGVELDDDGAEE